MTPFAALKALAVLALLLAAGLAQAAPAVGARMALVIGNGSYAPPSALPNAGNDARLMARTLAALGYTVTERHDLDRKQLDDAVTRFANGLPQGATAFVYFAGHGMQIEGTNYLTPVDMVLSSPAAAQVHSYSLKGMLDRLARSRSAVNIVVLDACRNNPFRPSGERYRSFRDLGLSQVAAPRGTFIAYSTAPGQLALDGKEGNSVYTRTLASVMREPGRDLESVFKRTAELVRRATLDDQMPWYESSLAGRLLLSEGAPLAVLPARAGGGRPGAQQPSRSMATAAPVETQPAWYREVGAAEWSRVDWEIQQRVKNLTPDEIPALKHKAGAGSVVAQTVLGLAYREGIERANSGGKTIRLRANNTVAWSWLNKAAAAGFPVAQAEIGEMYYGAHGVERDLAASRHWLEQAAAADYPRARLDLLQLNLESNPDPSRLGPQAQEALRSLFDSLGVPPPGRK
ncbi:caspase family protein [Telluria beijingensis]|uniref:caspase family protein n=1 Tax=Telluria beijingensis TaxID=3068633 RepID=UPI002795EA78|nr:caspase family protein [Massilia sp. REN29]